MWEMWGHKKPKAKPEILKHGGNGGKIGGNGGLRGFVSRVPAAFPMAAKTSDHRYNPRNPPFPPIFPPFPPCFRISGFAPGFALARLTPPSRPV